MTTHVPLEGHFATDGMRRWERRFQLAGIAALSAAVVGAATGLFGNPESVARSAAVYLFLLLIFRVSGRRTLAQVTNFDLILVLIIGDATQQALVGNDHSFMTVVVVVSTLVLIDIALGKAKRYWPMVDAVVDGLPLPIIVSGTLNRKRMASEGVTTDDVLTAAREVHGISRLDEVDSAVLEQSGGISVVPIRNTQAAERTRTDS
jgi:uncharacterized membrane protein YcaP (DUF421 family)